MQNDNQGKRLLSFRKTLISDIEGFQNTLDEVTERELDELKSLEQTFMKTLGEYTTAYKVYMTDISNLINSEKSGYIGKNIKTNDGIISYISNMGIARSYTNDTFSKRHETCGDNEPLTVNADNVSKLGFNKGTPMRENEPCGFSGKNVYVGDEQPKYMGCFKDMPSRALPKQIGVMTFNEALNAAKNGGYKYFSLQDAGPYGNKKAQIFVSNDDNYGKYGPVNCNSKLNTGEITGGSWTNAVYKTPNSHSQVGYIDKDNVFHLYNGNTNIQGCPTDKTSVTQDVFSAFKHGDSMTPETVCEKPEYDLGLKSEIEQLNNRLMQISTTIDNKITSIKERIHKLDTLNEQQQEEILNDLNEYNGLYSKYDNLDKKGYASLDAMMEDTQLIETSNLYSYIIWTILTLCVIYFTFRHIK